ncbi:MAG: DUF4833 domain-containing protein [Bacteroidetes bacterium]|nr:DUF4833 domain-containing protein [Bacteroidota bacterium]
MKFKNSVLLLLLFVGATSFTPISSDGRTMYPKPQGIENMLFYIQRTINSNTIVYALNQNNDGSLNETEPIKVYWIKYEQGGKIDPLTYIQKNYAYGIKSTLLDKEKKSYLIEFVSYHKRQFYLLKSKADNKYHVWGYFNNKLTILNNILVKIEGGTFWVPNIKYVEVKTMDPTVSEEITEIIKP